MKRNLQMLILLLICVFAFSGCDIALFQADGSQTTNDNFYTVEIANPEKNSILNELKNSYKAGEKVTIELATITEHYYVLYVNGVKQSPDQSISNDWSVTYYTFVMPAENVTVTIEDVWLELP